MNTRMVSGLLDQSCGKAISSWFEGKSFSHDEAYKAMEALPRKLGGNEKPDYDHFYTPPAYVLRYQLGHTFMAWRVLFILSQRWDRGPLRIVDFGAGTSACRIGATLMVADSIRAGHDIENIHVDEIDNSTPMQNMGESIWKEFVAGVQLGFANTPLAQAVKIVESKQHRDWRSLQRRSGTAWLTAFHTIYPSSYKMQDEIDKLIQRVSPSLGAFSCHKPKLGSLRTTFPFEIFRKWDRGNFPKFRGATDGNVECPSTYEGYRGPSTYMGELAVVYGFRKRNLPPYLQVKDCAILYGDRIPF